MMGGAGSKIQEIPSRKSLSALSPTVHRNEPESGADRYEPRHSADYLYAICRSCRREGRESERENRNNFLALACWCVCSGA